MKSVIKILFLCLAVSEMSCAVQKPVRIVLMPDTQNYAETHPDIFNSQTEWIAAQCDSIAFVLQQGDITNRNAESQWKVAVEAMSRLDGKVPYVMAVGNHDLGLKGRTRNRDSGLFNRYFPYDKYARTKNFGGAFEFGKMENVWYTFRTGGVKWLVLSLEFGPRDSVLAWAGAVIDAHSRHKVIINTHAYLYSDDTRMGPGDKWLPESYGIGKDKSSGSVNNGEQMWDKLIGLYSNIVFVFSGHVLNDGTGCLISEGVHGNRVCQMMANYQAGTVGSVNGGNGFLRILDIDAKNGRVVVRSYSPYTDTFRTEPDHQFVVEGLDFKR